MPQTTDTLTLQKLLMECLGRDVAGRDDQMISSSLVEVIRRNRLEGLVYSASTLALPTAWQKTYQQRQIQGRHLLKVAEHFSAALESTGVPCLVLRGPMDAVNLYGDVAARAYSDIDLYVPRSQVNEAWGCARKFGFSLYHVDMPKGYYVRNHLNWALVHKEWDVMCDLHWAIDHPFQNVRMDYAEIFNRSEICIFEGKKFRMPCAEDWLLLTAQHFLKHQPDLAAMVTEDECIDSFSQRGCLKYLMDLSFFIKREGETLDWGVVQNRAALWNVEEAFFCSVVAASLLVEPYIPATVLTKASHFVKIKSCAVTPRPPTFVIRALNYCSRNQGFRFDRMNTLLTYSGRPEESLSSLPLRGLHLLIFLTRLLVAGIDTLLCLCWANLRKSLKGSDRSHSRSPKPMEVHHG